MSADTPEIQHATAVAVSGRGLLIRGASGSGKSSLALAMMAHGAQLVADDRVIVRARDGALWLEAPAPLEGLIEARGIGLLGAETSGPVRLFAVLDLDREEEARLPQRRETMLQGQRIPLLHKTAHPYFPAALMQYLRGDRRE